MKAIDFTKLGGFRFTQDTLAYLQEGYTEAIAALCSVGTSTSGPMRISGMVVTEPTPGDFAVTDGWFFYSGKLHRFVGDTVTPGSDVALVEITNSASPLVFNDGTPQNVILESVATLIAAPSATDATHFPLSALIPFGREKSWTTVSHGAFIGNDSNLTGSIQYKKCYLTNTLHIRGALSTTTSGAVTALPSPDYSKFTNLPAGYRPVAWSYIEGVVTSRPLLKTIDNVDWLRTVYLRLEDDGDLAIEILQNSGGGGAYSVSFNKVISLE